MNQMLMNLVVIVGLGNNSNLSLEVSCCAAGAFKAECEFVCAFSKSFHVSCLYLADYCTVVLLFKSVVVSFNFLVAYANLLEDLSDIILS